MKANISTSTIIFQACMCLAFCTLSAQSVTLRGHNSEETLSGERSLQATTAAQQYLIHNAALNKPTSQSSTLGGTNGRASNAVDGSRNGNYLSGSITHTIVDQFNPWWQVDLQDGYYVNQITIFNRQDCCTNRLVNPIAEVIENGVVVASSRFEGAVGDSATFSFSNNVVGDSIRIRLEGSSRTLSLAEVEVNARLAWKWTDEFSEEQNERNGVLSHGDCHEVMEFGPYRMAVLVTGYRCIDSYCDDQALRCEVPWMAYSIPTTALLFEVDRTDERNSGFFSEETSSRGREISNEYQCEGDDFLYRVDCDGNYCDNIALHCGDVRIRHDNIRRYLERGRGVCAWTNVELSEEGLYDVNFNALTARRNNVAEYIVPRGSAIAGIECAGSHCDLKRFYTCVVSHRAMEEICRRCSTINGF